MTGVELLSAEMVCLITHRVAFSVTIVVHVYRVLNEEGRGIRRRSTGDLIHTINCQEGRFRQLFLRDSFATIREIGNRWLEEKGRPVSVPWETF